MFVVTEDWYFVSHRLGLAKAAKKAGFEVSIAARVGGHRDVIEKSGLTLHNINFDRSGVGPLREVSTIANLIKLYRQERPDIVHHVAMKPVVYGSIAARVAGIKFVVNALGGLGFAFRSTGWRASAMKNVIRPLLKRALSGGNSRLILQNEDDRRMLTEMKLIDGDKTRLIKGAGINLETYPKADCLYQPPLVVLPARLLKDKGVGEFVAAAKALREEGCLARFALVGEPDPANPASFSKNDIEQWKSSGEVECWGWRKDMPNVFAQAQIVCLPSYHEGLPKALLEAAASHCAMVATDIPGCRPIVKHGETGWLVRPRDVESLKLALREAIERPDLRQKFAAAAYDNIKKEFTLERVVAQTLAIYEEFYSA